MNILVTGGTGYIGSHTVVALLDSGHDVTILDNLNNSHLGALESISQLAGRRPLFYLSDLCNLDNLNLIFDHGHFDAVIHFAGLKAVGESVSEPLKYYENNLIGTLNLLHAIKSHNVKKLIFSSSATVYGAQPAEKFTEEMPTGINISNPYGWTKSMIEQILKDFAAAENTKSPDNPVEISLLRYFNPIGNHPSGLLGENPNGQPNNLMPIIMQVARGERSELTVFGDDYDTPDGTCVRDYIHVVDLADGHLKALEYLKPGVNTYNLGSGQGTSVLELIHTFEEVSGKTLPYKIGNRRPGDLAGFYANPEKAKRELHWQTKLTVKDAMRDTLKFLELSTNKTANNNSAQPVEPNPPERQK
ncbi:MAG: UDP-glucose 4-epimerase GalE [Candidatus Saccharibacteria bacterium]|nr:UDP-glucose 4-epimerase GalE [Candidatus Saccharibacteria bacterium]